MQRLYHITIHLVGNQFFLFILKRQCNTCEQFKFFDEFNYDSIKKDGYASYCIKCKKDTWNNASPEEKARRKEVRKASEDLRREEIRAYDRERSKTPEFHAQRNARHKQKREVILLERQLNPSPPKPIPTTKICPKCDPPVEKSLDEFPNNRRNRDKHGSYCNECMSKWYKSENTKAKAREYQRRKRESDPEYSKKIRQGMNQSVEEREPSFSERTYPSS